MGRQDIIWRLQNNCCSKQSNINFSCLIDTKNQYSKVFSEESLAAERQALWAKRGPKIQAINEKIDRAKSKVQQVTPAYIDQLIGLYERKNTSQKDRVYILTELKKYYSPEIIQFFTN